MHRIAAACALLLLTVAPALADCAPWDDPGRCVGQSSADPFWQKMDRENRARLQIDDDAAHDWGVLYQFNSINEGDDPVPPPPGTSSWER